ncbi:MAG: DUF3187 family protein [Desulfuromonadaceae bacterium]|nr:DUF3187 family protein [Desulfuromonadaceae bacterium]
MIKNRPIRNTFVRVFLTLLGLVVDTSAADMKITPFSTSNQSPLVQIHGIPRDTAADITPVGTFDMRLAHDLSSNYAVSNSASERITLDGEIYRTTVSVRYGVARNWEAGIEIPYVFHGGGFLDNFIIGWHSTFTLPQGGRNNAPKNRLNYSYQKNGIQKIQMDHTISGLGDLSLTGGVNLYDGNDSGLQDRVSLKAAIKLPTGDSTQFLGSGSTDVALLLCGGINRYTEWGSLGLFGSVGALAMTRGDLLPDQQKHIAGLATLGAGWGPASWISFKVQLNGSTPLYGASSLAEISKSPMLLILGGALRFPEEYSLDIGVGEDVAVNTAPDVSFYLGLNKRF